MQKILIIEARFYSEISDLLLAGAVAKLKAANIDFDIVNVPGALEIPPLIAMAVETNKYAGFIALGCVIRGETSHYDIVCNESARGLMKISMKKKIPVTNGILTVENKQQAIVRADPKQKDKGGFAANACLEMLKLKKQFS